MADAIRINSGKYKKEGKVEVDGNTWSVKLPGAASDLRISQLQRRQKVLEKKIESGNASEADLDKCDEIELVLYEDLKAMFSDGTEANESVIKWMDETPLAIIVQVVEDIKEQANGRKDQTASTD